MPLPFIIGGIALATGAYGIKKGVDAKDDFDTAERYNQEAKKIYDEAKRNLEYEREVTNSLIVDFGKLKISIYYDSLSSFVNIFSKIKKIDFKDNLKLELLSNVSSRNITDIRMDIIKIQDILGGDKTITNNNILAGFGALGGVGILASASTGTAITSLSGAAATNATLAWLGGGSLAAGGFGMAILGGIVSTPVLAIGGMIAASKAKVYCTQISNTKM